MAEIIPAIAFSIFARFFRSVAACASVMIQPVHLLGSLGDRMRRDKFVLDAGQNPRLDLLTGDGPTIVSGAPPVMVVAGIAARRDDAELAAAASAGEKAGQERNRLAHNCPVDVL